jgi:hypothetical protein
MRFGKFRPRFVSIGQANSLEESLVMSANEGAISLQPSLISHLSIPNVVERSRYAESMSGGRER